MSWFKKLAATRRADGISDIGMYWSLWTTRWFGVALVLRYRSDSSFSQREELTRIKVLTRRGYVTHQEPPSGSARYLCQRAESNRIKIVLDGEVLEHYELPRTGEAEPAEKVEKDAYVYHNAYGLWACRRLEPKRVVFERCGRRGGLELLDARTVSEKIVDFPHWLELSDTKFDAQRKVWLLTITWGGCWR